MILLIIILTITMDLAAFYYLWLEANDDDKN